MAKGVIFSCLDLVLRVLLVVLISAVGHRHHRGLGGGEGGMILLLWLLLMLLLVVVGNLEGPFELLGFGSHTASQAVTHGSHGECSRNYYHFETIFIDFWK